METAYRCLRRWLATLTWSAQRSEQNQQRPLRETSRNALSPAVPLADPQPEARAVVDDVCQPARGEGPHQGRRPTSAVALRRSKGRSSVWRTSRGRQSAAMSSASARCARSASVAASKTARGTGPRLQGAICRQVTIARARRN